MPVVGTLSRLAVFLASLLAATAAPAGQTYIVSVVPQYTPVDIGLRWTPLLARLEKETGMGFQLRAREKIPAFEKDFLAGIPDLVYLNPYHMVMAAKAQGYLPLVRGKTPLTGILVVDRAGPVKTLADLDGGTLAFPAPAALGASLYLRALLTDKEGIRFTPHYVGNHQNVYRHVLLGEAVGGGGVRATLAHEPESMRNRLHVLYTTPEVAPHPLAAHPRVPVATRQRIAAALAAIARDPSGRKMLAEVELDEAVPADYARDYLPLEKLKLERFLVGERK